MSSPAAEYDEAAQTAAPVADNYFSTVESEANSCSGEAKTKLRGDNLQAPPDRILSIAETAVTNAKAMIAAGEVVSQVVDIVPRLMTEAQRFRPRLVHQLSQPAGPA